MSFSTFSFAESSRSMFLEYLPLQCEAEDIIKEIPFTMSGFDILETLDVVNVKTIEKISSKLICSAEIVTEKGNKKYKITFTQNSMGNVIVSY